ncbi:hypothetical protein ARMGADRAFT_605692 [Armillaria gallica]|uniref:Peptidase C14 caspase domain-containing protein n=1 Tax=Armillaria gallica TaxID=47427 RepID=A0A2H3CN74_ARMGA|nr:hypothetical protein ARMGADRAFT_605692 [Armillaria gallica]
MPEYAKDDKVSKPDLPEDPRLKDLEEKEKEWAKQYGLPYPVDHDEVFRALQKNASKTKQEHDNATTALDEAKELNRLRIERNERLKIPYTAKLDSERIWAVIIGIDAYPERPGNGDQRLWGCVRDALAFKDYLTDDLRLSDNHINLLLGPHADDHYNDDFRNSITRERYLEPNRANIVTTLRGLSTREEIGKNDVIIIFFAGHGAAYWKVPLDDGESADIEALCPMDRGATDKAGAIIPDISDRETNSILTEISRAKGHNIAVVLDCCYAGSTTRDAGMVRGTARSMHKLWEPAAVAVMKSAADMILPGETVWHAGWKPDTKSHVCLAGCKSDEKAKEVKSHGVPCGRFTYDLLHALTLDSESEATFEQLYESLPSYIDQNPILFGDHKKSRIWYAS